MYGVYGCLFFHADTKHGSYPVLSAILCFAFKNIINAKTIETEYPKTVAVAAPLIPIAGKKPIPKIRSGSKMKLVITPVS